MYYNGSMLQMRVIEMSINETKYLLPQELLDNFYSIYSPHVVDNILRSYNSRRRTSFRINGLKTREGDVINEFRENGIKFSKCSWYNRGFVVKNCHEKEVASLKCYKEGKIYLQNLSSMLPVLFMDLREGLTILDLCAAPGSKTTQIADSINNKGYILSNEINKIRSERLKFNIAKLGVECAQISVIDGRRIGGQFSERFDRVLLDAPCSGEGTICMEDRVSYSGWSVSAVSKNSRLQKELLESARLGLKSGGILIYSTCTISVEENEEVIDWFINKYSDMKIVGININLSNATSGLTEYKGKSFAVDIKKSIRIIPDEEMEGFYVCKIRKA
jgi:NOL1/NOP2/sun family putative RNA methylase